MLVVVSQGSSGIAACHSSSSENHAALTDLVLLQVPKNLKLLAVPLFELHDNMAKFGPVIAAIPQLMSRFKLNLSGQTVPETASNRETDETAGARLS